VTARRIYLDHNATTPLRPEARAVLLEVLDGPCGNPSSVHASGRAARALVDEAREVVAAALGVSEADVVFTSGATESNNLALRGALTAAGPGSALITTQIEHPSVLEPARALERSGHALRLVGVDAAGRIDADEVARLAPGAAVVSIGVANGEVGSVAPLRELAILGVPERSILHVDASQAVGRLPFCMQEWGARLASVSAHKLGGPPGVGVLVRRGNIPLLPLQVGGGQEGGLRAGTENVPGIAAAARAIEIAVAEQRSYAQRAQSLVSRLWQGLHAELPGVRVTGPGVDAERRLPNTLNVALPHVDGRSLVARLDLAGLEVSAGSACASGSLEPSPVLLALGLDREQARRGLRLSTGWSTTLDDIQAAVEILLATVGAAGAT